jgi:hypothetical protein
MPRNRNEGHEVTERLRNDIDLLLESVECLLPRKAASVVFSYQDCGSLPDVSRWRLRIIERVLELAESRPGREMGQPLGSGKRAYSALCRSSSLSG